MDKHKLILPISIILGCIIITGLHFAIIINRQKSIEKQQVLQFAENKRIEDIKTEEEKIKESLRNDANCQSFLKYLQQRWNNVVDIYYSEASKTCIVKYTAGEEIEEAPIDEMRDN